MADTKKTSVTPELEALLEQFALLQNETAAAFAGLQTKYDTAAEQLRKSEKEKEQLKTRTEQAEKTMQGLVDYLKISAPGAVEADALMKEAQMKLDEAEHRCMEAKERLQSAQCLEVEADYRCMEAEKMLRAARVAHNDAMKFQRQNAGLIEAGKRVPELEEKIGQLEQKLVKANELFEIELQALKSYETKIKLPHGLTNNQKREITSEFNRVHKMYEAWNIELQSKLAAADQGNQGQEVKDNTEIKEDLGGPINPDAE